MLVQEGLILTRTQRGLYSCCLIPSLETVYAFPCPHCEAGGTPVVPFPSPARISPPRWVSVTPMTAASPSMPTASQKNRGLVLQLGPASWTPSPLICHFKPNPSHFPAAPCQLCIAQGFFWGYARYIPIFNSSSHSSQ